MSTQQTNPEEPAVPEWTLGWRLKRALAKADLTTQEIADEFGIGRSAVSNWTNDKGPVRAVFVKQWAMRCGVPYEWLAYGIDNGQHGPADQASTSSPCMTGDLADVLGFPISA